MVPAVTSIATLGSYGSVAAFNSTEQTRVSLKLLCNRVSCGTLFHGIFRKDGIPIIKLLPSYFLIIARNTVALTFIRAVLHMFCHGLHLQTSWLHSLTLLIAM